MQKSGQYNYETFNDDMKKYLTETGNLSFPAPYISESCIKIKVNLDFYFHTSCWFLKRFYGSVIKHFETPQRSVKIKI